MVAISTPGDKHLFVSLFCVLSGPCWQEVIRYSCWCFFFSFLFPSVLSNLLFPAMSLLAVGGILFLITNMQVQEPSFRLEKLKKITVSFDQSANYFLDYSTAYKMSENVILSVQVGFFFVQPKSSNWRSWIQIYSIFAKKIRTIHNNSSNRTNMFDDSFLCFSIG